MVTVTRGGAIDLARTVIDGARQAWTTAAASAIHPGLSKNSMAQFHAQRCSARVPRWHVTLVNQETIAVPKHPGSFRRCPGQVTALIVNRVLGIDRQIDTRHH